MVKKLDYESNTTSMVLQRIEESRVTLQCEHRVTV